MTVIKMMTYIRLHLQIHNNYHTLIDNIYTTISNKNNIFFYKYFFWCLKIGPFHRTRRKYRIYEFIRINEPTINKVIQQIS